MAARDLPNLALKAFFDLGEDGWDDEMSLNLLKLSVLVQGGAINLYAAEPGAPTNGDVIILDETHATHPNAVAIRDAGAWVYVTPQEGWLVYNRTTNTYVSFDGTEWAPLDIGGVISIPYSVGFGFTTALTASEIVLLHTFAEAVTFADDFAGSVGDVGTNPGANQALDVRKNASSVGTITISSAGAFTFVSSGGATDFAVGDQLRIVGPASVGTAANVSITLLGVRI